MNAEKQNSAIGDNYDNQTLNRISGSSGMSGFTNTLAMGAQGYQSESHSNKPSDSNSYVNNLNRESFQPQKNIMFAQNRELFEDDIEDKEGDMTVITTTSTSYLPFASNTVKDFFRSTMSPKKRRSKKMKYSLKLSIQYETQIGEYLAVIGNIEELGNWTNFNKCQIKWTEGHNWVTDNLVISSKSHFLYKYVIMEHGKVKMWEKGANRIADLEVLPDMNKDVGKGSTHQLLTPSHSHMRLQKQKSISPEKNTLKHVQIIDEWEHFKIRFSINDPILEDAISHGDFMRIIGSTPKLGSQGVGEMEQTPPMRMSRAQRPFEWLLDKYGQLERPWEIIISFRNGELEFPNEIIYNYSKSNESGTSIVKEREPSRSMVIQQPETYQGELGKQGSIQWKNSQYVWIVNGVIDKADGNFLGGLYFDKIGDTKIFMGTYPLLQDDIFKMRDKGITGILNLQTENDIKQRGVPWKQLKGFYQQCNIRSFRFPLSDNNEDEYCANLFMVAQHLNNMINNMGLNVYIHCTSGISRAPSVILVYLCLFKRVKQWQNPYYVAQFVKAFHLNSSPNMRAVQRVVEANLEFQRQQVDINSKAHISQEPISGQSDETQPEFYFPQMVDNGEKKKPMRNNMTPLKPRSAYIKKEYYRSHMEQPNNQRSVTPLLANTSQKPLLIENLDKQDNDDHDDQLSLQQNHKGLTDNEEQSNKPFGIGQQNFENAQPVTSESATIQNDPDQFRSMLLPEESSFINKATPEKMLKSTIPDRFQTDQSNQKEDLQRPDDTLGYGENTTNPLQFERDKIDHSPISNHQPDIEFGFKQTMEKPSQIEFGFKPVETEEMAASPPHLPFGRQNDMQNEEKHDQSPQQEQEDEQIQQQTLEPEEIREQFPEHPEQAPIVNSAPMAPMAPTAIPSPMQNLMRESVATLDSKEDSNAGSGLIEMQNNYRVQKANRAREFKRKRESNSREKSFLRNSQAIQQQNVNLKNVLTDDLLFQNQSQQQIKEPQIYSQRDNQYQPKTHTGHSLQKVNQDNEFLEDIINQGLPSMNQNQNNQYDFPSSHTRQSNFSPLPAPVEESQAQITPRTAVRPYTKSAQRRVSQPYDSVERIRRADSLSSHSKDSPSQRFSHFDQIKKNYAERRNQNDTIKQQQLTAQKESTNLAIKSYITTELIDKECSRIIRQAFQNEIENFHEQKLVEERRAREQAENENARLREENIKAKNRTIEIEKLAREEAEKEIQRLKREKFERQQNELRRRQKLAEDRAERQRLMKMAEEMEMEKERLRQIAEENEAERRRIQLESEQLKQQEDQHQRSQSLMRMQQAEEEVLERQRLQRIARDKEERIKLQKKFEEENNQKQQQNNIQEQQIVKPKEEPDKKTKILEEEILRLETIRKAQQELEELQRLRLQEEERLKKIKKDISIEEENLQSARISQMSPQREFSKSNVRDKEAESRNNYFPKPDTFDKEIVTISEKQEHESPQNNDKCDQTPQRYHNTKSKVNVYYEVRSSGEGANENVQNKSFEQTPQVNEVKKQNPLLASKTRNQSLNKVNSPVADEKSLQTAKVDARKYNSGILHKEEPTFIAEEVVEKPPIEVDLTEEDVETHCDKIFGKEAPIKFKCRPGNKIEETLQKLINKLNIRVPIVHVRAGIYLVGSSKVNLEQKFNHVMVRKGGGAERFDYYMPKHHRKFEKQLVQYMSISQSDLQTVVDKIIAGQKIKKNVINNKQREIEESEKKKRNRSGNVAVKRVQVKLHGDTSSNAGSLQSRRTKEQINIEKDRVTRDLSSDRSLSQGGHFLNKSIVDSINKHKMARGYSPIRMRPDLKNSFENTSIQNNNEQQSRIVPFTAQSQVVSLQNPNKCTTPKNQIFDSSGHRDELPFKLNQGKTSKFDADTSPRHQFSQMQITEPAKTTRQDVRKYKPPTNNFSRNPNQKSHYLGAGRNKQFNNNSSTALEIDVSSSNTSPKTNYNKYLQQTSSANQKQPTVYQKMLGNRTRGDRQTGHRF